jgi:hypothetical protein
MADVMIDLETLGVGHSPAVLSIGAVVFDPLGPPARVAAGSGSQFYVNIDLLSCVMAGLIVETDTVSWWRDQSPEARSALYGDSALLQDALVALDGWLASVGAERIWTNGPMSDHVWLESAYRAVGMRTLMERKNGYRAPRCYRTIVEAAEYIADFDRDTVPGPAVAHDALEDAAAQALGVQMAFAALRRHTLGPAYIPESWTDRKPEHDAQESELDRYIREGRYSEPGFTAIPEGRIDRKPEHDAMRQYTAETDELPASHVPLAAEDRQQEDRLSVFGSQDQGFAEAPTPEKVLCGYTPICTEAAARAAGLPIYDAGIPSDDTGTDPRHA